MFGVGLFVFHSSDPKWELEESRQCRDLRLKVESYKLKEKNLNREHRARRSQRKKIGAPIKADAPAKETTDGRQTTRKKEKGKIHKSHLSLQIY